MKTKFIYVMKDYMTNYRSGFVYGKPDDSFRSGKG